MDVALVTGAYKGLGLEWCRQLGKLGYSVVMTARDIDKAITAAGILKEEGMKVYPAKLDVTKQDEINEIKLWCRNKFEHVDIIVNNAGINSGTRSTGDKKLQLENVSIDSLSKSELLAMMDVNAVSPIMIANTFRPLLRLSQNPKVINIGSWLGSIDLKKSGGNYSYAVSKSGLNMMNRAFAYDVLPENIISVVVNPGWVQTDMGGSKANFTPEEAVKNLIENVMLPLTISDTGRFLNYDGSEHPW